MDTSKEYIEMCEKAYKDLKEAHIVFSRRRRMLYVVDDKVGRWDNIVNTDNTLCAFPLWEQDQLQEMLPEAYSLPYGINNLHDWMLENPTRMEFFNTMEKLWLGVVMSELYDKKWEGNEWV